MTVRSSSSLFVGPPCRPVGSFFFFNDTATTEIYTLSLHDALPISCPATGRKSGKRAGQVLGRNTRGECGRDRKSTRLNSSHGYISYAVFCLKKKNSTSKTSSQRDPQCRVHDPGRVCRLLRVQAAIA